MNILRRLSVALAIMLGLTLLATPAHADWGNTIETDPYNNQGEFVRENLPVEKDAILPNVVYPFLPDGGMIANANLGELSNAPNVGAVESIVLFLAGAFRGNSSAGITGQWMWKLTIAITVFGMLLSGFMTYKAVMQGKKGPGEGTVGYLTKIALCVFMVHAMIPNLPPMLIGLTNVVTAGIDHWFVRKQTNANKPQENTQTLDAQLNSKLAASHHAAAAMYGKILEAAARIGAEPENNAIIKDFINRMKNDEQVQLALGGKTKSTIRTGLFSWQSANARMSDLYRPEIQKMLEDGKSNTEISARISDIAAYPGSIIINRSQMHLNDAFRAADAQNRPGSAALTEAIIKSPQGIDVSSFATPTRILAMSAYIAFAFLSISIWGMGFAAMIWVMLYSMPEEWNFQGILASGFKGGLGIVLSSVLIAIYLGSSLKLTITKTDKAIDSVWDKTTQMADKTLSVVTDVISNPIDSAINGGQQLLGIGLLGDAWANAVGMFNGFTLEQLILGMLILTAPAQAAAMMKGANGIGESGAKALTANGAGGQGMWNSIFGSKATTSSGASLRSESSAAGAAMTGRNISDGIDRSTMLRPTQKS